MPFVAILLGIGLAVVGAMYILYRISDHADSGCGNYAE